MIIFSPHRRSPPVSHGNNNESKLCQLRITAMNEIKLGRHILVKRTWVNRRYYRIMFRGIKIKWLPHHAIQIRNTICRFYFKTFRSFPPHLFYPRYIGLLQIHDFLSVSVSQNDVRFQIDPLISINKIIKRFRPIYSMSHIVKCQLLHGIWFIQTSSTQCSLGTLWGRCKG